MNILVIAPHPDDEVIGCGGALCRRAERGDRIFVVFLTSGELGLKHLKREAAWKIREQEARRAGQVLGVADMVFLRQPDWMVNEHVAETAEMLRPILHQESPGLIYLPHPNDWHPDHQATLPLLREALRGSSFPAPELRAYEIWTPMTHTDDVVDITPVMERKLKALRKYQSQLVEFNYLRAIRGLNQFRGELAARCRYAEVFATPELDSGQ
ncbi:MAG TPA: PIG-L deacetylase family protein [Dongiaceae bacterium]|jgi:LmbE family N-acetylglucosaminyl deacetylase|nr:PIG-L deacetylase family protein [Dongiaceae bacterium]